MDTSRKHDESSQVIQLQQLLVLHGYAAKVNNRFPQELDITKKSFGFNSPGPFNFNLPAKQ
jgi:hypothetical protein